MMPAQLGRCGRAQFEAILAGVAFLIVIDCAH